MSIEPEWVEFDALLEATPWGRSIYTILRVDHSLEEAATSAGTRRVEGTIEDVPVNVAVSRADVLPDAFMYAGKPLQRRLGARPGDLLHCRLRPADPRRLRTQDTGRAAAPAPTHRGSGQAGDPPPAHRRAARLAAARLTAAIAPPGHPSTHPEERSRRPRARKLGMMAVDDPRGSAG